MMIDDGVVRGRFVFKGSGIQVSNVFGNCFDVWRILWNVPEIVSELYDFFTHANVNIWKIGQERKTHVVITLFYGHLGLLKF